MAAAATNTAAFHLFTSLPPELRNLIWHMALPDEVERVLYFYKQCGWCPLHLTMHGESKLHLEYRHELLDAVQVEIPLFLVNHEARYIALAWMHEHNIKMRVYTPKYGQSRSPVFVRPFDPVHHTLYIAVDKWIEFLSEPSERCAQPDMIEQYVCPHPASVTSIVIPEALFQVEGEVGSGIAESMDWDFYHLKALFIMVNTPVDLQPVNNSMKIQPQWELKNVDSGAFFWNHTHGRFDFVEGESIMDEALYKLIEGINTRLAIELAENSIRSFEIRPVLAIRT